LLLRRPERNHVWNKPGLFFKAGRLSERWRGTAGPARETSGILLNGPLQEDVGDQDAARASAQQAVALAEQHLRRDPASPESRMLMATALHRLSMLMPDLAAKQATAQRSIAALEPIRAARPEKGWVHVKNVGAISHLPRTRRRTVSARWSDGPRGWSFRWLPNR
jgi:hypothetical protein